MTTTPEEFVARQVQQLLAAETGDSQWWYLSFTDDTRPEGDQFIGGLLLKAHGMISAVQYSHLLGLNPGGAVTGLAFPYEDDEADPWACRLLTRSEAEGLPEPRAVRNMDSDAG